MARLRLSERRVASSFSAWYRDWLDAAVRDTGPWCAWDTSAWATPGVFAKVELVAKEGHEGEAARARIGQLALSVKIRSGTSAYFASGSLVDLCHALRRPGPGFRDDR